MNGIDFTGLSLFDVPDFPLPDDSNPRAPLLPTDTASIQNHQALRKKACDPRKPLVATGAAAVFVGGLVLRIYNEISTTPSDKLGTGADLIMGIATAAFTTAALPDCICKPLFNEVKRWSVPLFEIATNLYINLEYIQNITTKELEIVKNAFYTPVNMATGALTTHDVLTLATMKQGDLREGAIRDKPLPMIEGDAASLKRMALNQTAILVLGIALTTLGYTLTEHKPLDSIMRDAGLVTTLYSAGTISAQALATLVDVLDKQWKKSIPEESPEIPRPPFLLRLTNGIARVFQISYPQAVAMSMAPDNPIGYAVSGFFWGVGTQITRTLFQRRVTTASHEDKNKTLWSKVTDLFKSRKKEIALNGLFYTILTGWTIWGEISGGTARVRGGVATLCTATMASFVATSIADLLWKSGDSSIINSLYYNLIVQSPATLLYLFMQTKIIANDVYLNSSTLLGYGFGIAALAALGIAIGQDRWLQMREGRSDPSLTPLLGKALLAWTTSKRFFGILS